MTTRLDAFAPTREVRAKGKGGPIDERELRAYGAGGQFAKGGGRIPGRAVPAGLSGFEEGQQPLAGPVGTGAVEVSKEEIARLQGEIDGTNYSTEADDAVYTATDTWSNEVWTAHQDYIGSGYTRINGVARTVSDPSLDSGVNAMDRTFRPPPARPLEHPVFRGVGQDTFGPTLSVGERFIDRGFVSTSARGAQASAFAGRLAGGRADLPRVNHKTIYRISPTVNMLPRPVAPGSVGEREWILPRGSTFSVTKIQQYTAPTGSISRVIDLDWDGVEQ